MLLTLVLAFSVVGLILFIPKDSKNFEDSSPSTWMMIGRTLLENVVKKWNKNPLKFDIEKINKNLI